MNYLYTNENGFKVERKLGQTWYYCDVLKTAINRYGISESPDYDELDKIVKRIDVYMNSSRYEGALEAPIYVESRYASDIYLIRTAILKLDRKNKSKEEIRGFYTKQIKRLNEATKRNESLLWSS
ncbi:MAG: hypothetical protein ACXADU_15310 [Promethearchaeota archaeon]|jgi:hypothetical protein